ncbi:unnamed protein product [Brachionus calyciflorus]|uniref:Hexosyltransferase n=1 Tax=Brachionus calyciflorus TaxID=104777 RepID=A0A814DYC0_9BILA|nr:unnamed protein product [Brachionus calyciflorus]
MPGFEKNNFDIQTKMIKIHKKNILLLTLIVTLILLSIWLVLNEQQKIDNLKELAKNYYKLVDKEAKRHAVRIFFSAFTSNALISSKLGSESINSKKLNGLTKNDIKNLISYGTLQLNSISKHVYTDKDFSIGFTREIPSYGNEYKLFYLKNGECCSEFNLKRLFQPLDLSKQVDLNKIQITDLNESIVNNKQFINIILTISSNEKNYQAFKFFMQSFYFNSIKRKENFENTLTIVFGYESTDKVLTQKFEKIFDYFINDLNFDRLKIVRIVNDKYSRAKFIDIGVNSCCPKEKSLIFVTDIDVYFDFGFLNLCRLNAIEGKKVFYPILFSLYNPNVRNNNTVNIDDETFEIDLDKFNKKMLAMNIKISNSNGYWRESGYGMVCLYKKDYLNIGGFGKYKRVRGWGGEDVYLAERFYSKGYDLFRAITPGLYHLYHKKECVRKELGIRRYKACVQIKIKNEASQMVLGYLFFNKTEFLK